MERPICFSLERQEEVRADSRAWANTGKRIAARMAIMAMTTSNSMRVKALCFIGDFLSWCLFDYHAVDMYIMVLKGKQCALGLARLNVGEDLFQHGNLPSFILQSLTWGWG